MYRESTTPLTKDLLNFHTNVQRAAFMNPVDYNASRIHGERAGSALAQHHHRHSGLPDLAPLAPYKATLQTLPEVRNALLRGYDRYGLDPEPIRKELSR